MAELLVGSLDVRVVGGIWLRVSQGFPGLAKVRGTNTVIAEREGQIWRPKVKHSLGFVLDGSVIGDDEGDFLANLEALTAALDIGNQVTVTLGDGYLGASGEAIVAEAINWLTSDLVEGVQWQHWNIEFEAVDPPEWGAGSS